MCKVLNLNLNLNLNFNLNLTLYTQYNNLIFNDNGKGKRKDLPITGHECPEEEQMYSSTLPSTSTLEGVGGQRHAPAALPPGKTRYPLYRRLGGLHGF